MPTSSSPIAIARPAPLAPVEGARALRGADRLGAFASFVCALHCASWPLLLVLLPGIGGTFLGSELLERGFVLGASALALATLLAGWRRHRRIEPAVALLPGLLLIWVGSFGPWHHQLVPHAVLMTLGGLCVATAHLLNLRLQRAHRHGPDCRH